MSDFPRIHLSFPASDLESSVAFYSRLFGEGPVKTRPGYAKFLPSMAPLNLALHPGRTSTGGEPNHFGIEVQDRASVMQHLERIDGTGLQTRVEMGVDCCHANQDKFWVKDPDGREWEIYVLNNNLQDFGGQSEDACCADQADQADQADRADQADQADQEVPVGSVRGRSSDSSACCG